jgi:hypothetical protein
MTLALEAHPIEAQSVVWQDGSLRMRALVPIHAHNPRELARNLMAERLAVVERKPGETWMEALQRHAKELHQPQYVVVNLNASVVHLCELSGMVEYLEFTDPRLDS